MQAPAIHKPYAQRFTQHETVKAYETVEYAAGSYWPFIWELKKPFLRQVLEGARRERGGRHPLSLLDFACGTGRVLSFVEELVDQSHGVDISPAMVEVAAGKCRKSSFFVGDITADPALASQRYDVITAFRFLLNAEPELRVSVLRQLRQRLREPDGLLIVSMHGNSRSLRHPAIAYRRWQRSWGIGDGEDHRKMLGEMSPAQTQQLLAETGFEVVRRLGFGVMPPMLHRTPLGRIAQGIDRWCAGRRAFGGSSVVLLYVCRPKPSTSPGVAA